MGGRPSDYTVELADLICEQIATTTCSLKTICNSNEDLPNVGTVLRWLRVNEEFRNQYTRAKEEQADMMAEEIIEISDDGSNDYMTVIKGESTYNVENKEVVGRSRLRVESRKWIAAKLKPKKYGDKVDMTTNGNDLPAIPLTLVQSIAERINANATTA